MICSDITIETLLKPKSQNYSVILINSSVYIISILLNTQIAGLAPMRDS